MIGFEQSAQPGQSTEDQKKSTAKTLKELGHAFLIIGCALSLILVGMMAVDTVWVSWVLIIAVFSGSLTSAFILYLCSAGLKVLEQIEDHLYEIRIELINRPR